MIETERLILREMSDGDFDALYKILTDSDIMQHYPYTFDEARVKNWIQRKGYAKEAAIAVRDWVFNNTPFNMIYSYMKFTNEPSAKTAMSYGCKQVDTFADEINEITWVFAISRDDWMNM